MSSAAETGDRLHRGFVAAVERAYDVNDFLAAFWQYAAPLARFELRASGSVCAGEVRDAIASLQRIDGVTFARDALRGEDLDALRTIAGACERGGLPRTAESLFLLTTAIRQAARDPPALGWSQFAVKELACPACGEHFRYKFWQVVNAMMRRDLRTEAVSGNLRNEARCYSCGTVIERAHFLYCDPTRDEFLIFWPYGEATDVEPFATTCLKMLGQLPSEVRGHKDRILFLSGTPVALFQEADIAAVTVCYGDRIFDEVVRDEVYTYAEATLNMDVMEDDFDAVELSHRGEWLPAAAAYARSFLKDPVRITPLAGATVCLRNLSRGEEADAIEAEAGRLRDVLLKHKLIQRIVRMKGGSSAQEFELHQHIVANGLPAQWGFSELCRRLQVLAEEA